MATPAWAARFLFEILPTAFGLIYDWAKEWQTLIAALLVIFAARIFARAIIRSSRIVAHAMMRIHEAPTVQPVGVTSVESKEPMRARELPLSEALPRQHAEVEPDLVVRLETLRNAVRSALAATPVTDGMLSDKGIELCTKVVSVSLEDSDFVSSVDEPSRSVLQELKTALDALRVELAGGMDIRQVWESLVHVNRLARELQSKISRDRVVTTEPATHRVETPHVVERKRSKNFPGARKEPV